MVEGGAKTSSKAALIMQLVSDDVKNKDTAPAPATCPLLGSPRSRVKDRRSALVPLWWRRVLAGFRLRMSVEEGQEVIRICRTRESCNRVTEHDCMHPQHGSEALRSQCTCRCYYAFQTFVLSFLWPRHGPAELTGWLQVRKASIINPSLDCFSTRSTPVVCDARAVKCKR